MKYFKVIFIAPVICSVWLNSSCSSSNVSPILSIGEPASGRCRIVLVSPIRGVQSQVEIDGDPSRSQALYPGGSVILDLAPGSHKLRLDLDVGIQAKEPVIFASFNMQEGETLYLNLNPSRPIVEWGTTPWQPGLGSSLTHSNYTHPINISLVKVSKETAIRIARF